MSASDVPTFPIRPSNRAALLHICYRLGTYPGIVDAMLRELNAATELEKWTHRAPDDPGIALVESAAVVADILTFYQEHYANEAFLRTARWRESIQELVRLTGYRLAPGTGGRASFALEVRGDLPVTVPAAFPLKAELEGSPNPVDFQTADEHTAIPHLGRFNLYRARQYDSGIFAGATKVEVLEVEDSDDPAELDDLDLKVGDKLMLVPPEPKWTTSGTSLTAQLATQIVKIKTIQRRVGRYLIEIEGNVNPGWTSDIMAYRIGRTFRHFGHNAPLTRHESIKSNDEVTGTNEFDTNFTRDLHHNCKRPSMTISLPTDFVPLDQEVSDILPRSNIIIQTPVTFGSTEWKLTVVRTVSEVTAGPIGLGDMNGTATFLTLTGDISSNNAPGTPAIDLRDMRIHEITSSKLTMSRFAQHPDGDFTDSDQLFFHGTTDEAEPLVGRALIFKADDGRFASANVVDVDLADPSWPRMRRVTLDAAAAGFARPDFEENEPTVTVYGNIVEATQGKAEKIVVIGNGDGRQTFQTFKIPKAPLTYLHDEFAAPPQPPELTIRVNGREWTRIDSLFGREPLEEVYIVRQDAEGNSYVQFGDGETGARLPSGVQNVTVEYRTGVGALGIVKAGSKPSAGGRLDALDKVQLPGEVTGGAEAEPEDKARETAPAKLQTLGRLVSLKDYESEALATPGVVAAAAAWKIADGNPAIGLRILLEQAQQSDAQFEAVAANLRAADIARGPDRHPIEVTQCEFRYVHLNVSYAFDPILRVEDVETALCAALGLAGDEANARTGLFGVHHRRLGEREYALRIAGALQNVSGIIWCRVVHFGLLDAGDDPEVLVLPSTHTRAAQVICAPTEMLQLHELHLTLTPEANT